MRPERAHDRAASEGRGRTADKKSLDFGVFTFLPLRMLAIKHMLRARAIQITVAFALANI